MTRSTLATLALLLLAAPCLAQEPAPARMPPIVGDFVEVGPMGRGVPRDRVVIRLSNDTASTLDVQLGEGAASLLPGDVLLARVAPGDVAVTATARDVTPVDRLEGTIRVEPGLAYALYFGHLPEGVEPGPRAPEDVVREAPRGGKPRRERVDVGRKRPRDRQ